MPGHTGPPGRLGSLAIGPAAPPTGADGTATGVRAFSFIRNENSGKCLQPKSAQRFQFL